MKYNFAVERNEKICIDPCESMIFLPPWDCIKCSLYPKNYGKCHIESPIFGLSFPNTQGGELSEVK